VQTKKTSGWFRVGVSPGEKQSGILMVFSFLIPVLIWCFVAYASFLWKVDYKLTLTGVPDDKVSFAASYVHGDTMAEDYFVRFQQSVRDDNVALAELYAAGGTFEMSERAARTDNKRLFRDFEPILTANALFDPEVKGEMETKDYYRLLYSLTYDAWGEISDGATELKKGTLSPENAEIIARNWELLSSVSPVYDANNLYSKPLYKLIPQGEVKIGRPSYLPAPHEIFATAWQDFQGKSELGELNIWTKYGESLKIVFLGFLMACLIGVPIALLAGTFPFFSKLIEPFTDFFRYMPAPAFSTVLIAIFGLADAPKMALVVMGTLPHLILMVANTTRMIDQPLLDAAQTLGAGKSKLVSKVIIPGILPNLYNDLRILLGWAWTWLVIAELIGAKSGLTEIIDTQGRRFHFDHVYPIIFLIGVTGFVTDQILSGLRGILFPWTSTGKVGLVGRIFLLPACFVKWLTEGREDSQPATQS
jgi:NitT/TauT family transport system permease protein